MLICHFKFLLKSIHFGRTSGVSGGPPISDHVNEVWTSYPKLLKFEGAIMRISMMIPLHAYGPMVRAHIGNNSG